MTTKAAVADIMTTLNAQNIARVYREANESQIARGMSWYADAHTFALSLDDDVERSAGIIAALSPRLDWERNMVLASRVYVDGFASGTLKGNCSKADEIFHHAPTFEVLSGPKVRAFARCIIDPTDRESVVIDRHAFDVAYGEVTSDLMRGVLDRKGMYEHVAALYVEAARQVGISPCQMQAVTWVVWRENHAAYRAHNLRRVNGEG